MNTTSSLVRLSTGREQRCRAEDWSYYGVYMQGGENPHGHPFKHRQADCLKESTIVPFILPDAAMDIELETHTDGMARAQTSRQRM